MRTIQIQNSIRLIVIDDEDFERVNKFKWYLGNRSIMGRTGSKVEYLGRFILNYTGRQSVDHADKNIFNNQKSNLRIATASQQGANRGLNRNNTSGYKGINWDKRTQSWRARIKVKYREVYLGRFSSIESAIKAYNEASKKYFGEFGYQHDIN